MAALRELPPGVLIRPLTPADAVERRRLRLEALQLFPMAFGSDYSEEASWPIERFGEFRPGGYPIGAFDGTAMVGTAILAPETMPRRAHWHYIFGMYVTPHFQGTAIAERLVLTLLDEARRRKIEAIELSCTDQNVRAKSFYLRMGFKIIGSRPAGHFFQGSYSDELILWMPL